MMILMIMMMIMIVKMFHHKVLSFIINGINIKTFFCLLALLIGCTSVQGQKTVNAVAVYF